MTAEEGPGEPRDGELRRVTDAVLAHRGSGRSQLFQIDGDLGVGKSVFLADVLGAVVAGGFAPDLLLRVHGARREGGSLFAALQPLVDALAGAEAGEIADAAERPGAAALAARCAEGLGAGGQVLAVDDADLLDPAEIDFLVRMLLVPSAPPLTLVLAHRDGSALGDLLIAARSRGMLHGHVALGPLAESTIAEIATGLEPQQTALVTAASLGNPLFARVLQEAFRRFPASRDTGEALSHAELNGSEVLGAAVAHDLGRLDRVPRRVLDVLAVLGIGADGEPAARVADLSRDAYAEGVRVLRERRLLPEAADEPLHPVIRHAVRMHLAADHRAALHREAARLPGIPARERAEQLSRLAGRLHPEETSELTGIAGSMCEQDPVSAVRWLRAIPGELLGTGAQLVLARALLRSGEAEDAADLLCGIGARGAVAEGAGTADADGGEEAVAETRALLARAYQAVGRQDEALGELRSLRRLRPARTPGVLRELVDAWMLVDGAADPELLQRLRDSGDGEHRLVSHTYEVFALLIAGEAAQARDAFAAVSAAWLELPDGRLPESLTPLLFAAWSAHMLEQFELCRRLGDRGSRAAREHGHDGSAALLHSVVAFALMQLGRLDEADETAEAAVREGERHGPHGATALAHSALVISAQARYTESRGDEQLRGRYEALLAAPLPQLVWWRRVVLSARSRASAALGAPESSPELMSEPVDAMSPLRYTDAALAAAQTENVELAVRLLEQAHDIAEEQGVRGQLAMVETQTAEVMLRLGRALEAKNLLLSAQPVFAELEMVTLQGHAHTLLAWADEALTRRSSRFGALSERELQVAELVAAGMKNREVAAHLVISPRTVENHVARMLRKLGVESRQDLAALFADDEIP